MNKKKIIFISILSLLIVIKAIILLFERTNEIENTLLPKATAISITLVEPYEGVLQNKRSYLGYVEAIKSATLSTKIPGYIKSISVSEAQKVHKNEALIHIDDTELNSSLKALFATLEQQKIDALLHQNIHQRNEKLYEVGGLAKEKLDLSKLTVHNKQALVINTEEKINQLQHQLTYLDIKAPFDGEIASVYANEGDLAAIGKPILTLNTMEKKILFTFPQGDKTIRVGQQVKLEDSTEGFIKKLYTIVSNGLIQAEVHLNTIPLYPVQSSLNVTVLTQKKEGCILPTDTVIHQKDGAYLMLYKDKKFIPYKVTIELSNEQNILLGSCQGISHVARGNESKLRELSFYENTYIVEKTNE
jgi:RND family efflux transporter MFP subunit